MNRDSNSLTLFRNAITQSNIIPIIVTLIAFDLICSKFSKRCPFPCLGIETTPAAFIKLQNAPAYSNPSLFRGSQISISHRSSPGFFSTLPSFKHLRVYNFEFNGSLSDDFREIEKLIDSLKLV